MGTTDTVGQRWIHIPVSSWNHRILKLEKTLMIIKSNHHTPPQNWDPLTPLHRHSSHLGTTESREAKSLAKQFCSPGMHNNHISLPAWSFKSTKQLPLGAGPSALLLNFIKYHCEQSTY